MFLEKFELALKGDYLQLAGITIMLVETVLNVNIEKDSYETIIKSLYKKLIQFDL